MSPLEHIEKALDEVRAATGARPTKDIDETNHHLLEAYRALRAARAIESETKP